MDNPPQQDYLDLATLVGCAGLGLSLYQIHIYVAVLKRALQVWGLRCHNGDSPRKRLCSVW